MKIVPYEDVFNEEVFKITNNNLEKSSHNLNNSLEESEDSMMKTSKIQIKRNHKVPTSVQLFNTNGVYTSDNQNINSNSSQGNSEPSSKVSHQRLLSPTVKQQRENIK